MTSTISVKQPVRMSLMRPRVATGEARGSFIALGSTGPGRPDPRRVGAALAGERQPQMATLRAAADGTLRAAGEEAQRGRDALVRCHRLTLGACTLEVLVAERSLGTR
jgi:hypothetical protein